MQQKYAVSVHAGQAAGLSKAAGQGVAVFCHYMVHVTSSVCVCVSTVLVVFQDIGERETHEVDALYSPLLQGLVGSVLADIDLSSQGIQLEGVDLKHLVRTPLQQHAGTPHRALQLVGQVVVGVVFW